MVEVISAGGIVIYKHQILMLKKKNGDWVLPKGRIEVGETLEETAVREVKEETNTDAKIIDYIGLTTYRFSNYWTKYQVVEKTVSWYYMTPLSFSLKPLRNEGFIEAKYIDVDKILDIARYDDERKVIKKAINGMQAYTSLV